MFFFTLISCLLLQSSLGALISSEQTILVNWYNSLTSKGTLGWNTTIDLCGQTGITCDSSNPQRVSQLMLTDNQLNGTIPTQFRSLTNLNALILNNNQLSGTIPMQLESLPNLQWLQLNNNQLNGIIPTQFASLTSLQWLQLTDNQLSGTIPTQLGSLPNLQNLYLDYNQLSGTIPTQLGSLTNLRYLYLENNQLSGTIPTQLGSLTNLQQLILNDNQLSGAIPTELGSLGKLQYLYFFNNQLSGTIPTQLGGLTNLKWLQLYSNQLSGTIPTLILTLPSTTLNLASNYWNCPIPDYSSRQYNDYLSSKSQCDSSCSPNRCSSGEICSIKWGGGYGCCLSGDSCLIDVICPYIANEGNAEWNETSSTLQQVVKGNCIQGYQGTISRTCIQSGPIGNWTSIIGSCNDINECSTNNGGCDVNAICTNSIGSYKCNCKPGYIGNGIECSPCAENEYSFNETTCIPCPENTTSGLASSSIIDCKCTLFNHYLYLGNSTCLPCDYGFKVDETLNVCQKVKCPNLSLNGSGFESIEIGKTEYSTCLPNYYVFQSDPPYSPIPNEKSEAICLLNNDNVTASWNIIQLCEPTCLVREGGCDNNQICAKPTGENIEKCFCAGYVGKYCETVDSQGCETLRCSNNGTCIDKKDTTAAYCKCDGTGYEGPFCENDINDCVTNVTCVNGGTCIDYGVNKTFCVCPFGVIGKQCELCTPDTCSNNGKCVIQNGISSCDCFGTGYEGSHCEISKNDCKTLPCFNGLCIELGNDTRKCSCLPGFEGTRCEIPKEDCRKNGCGIGRCITIPQNDTAYCNCFGTGYQGNNCEIQKEDCRINGCGIGRCITIPQNDTAYCNCFGTGYEGNNCEKEKDCRSKKCLNNGECRIDYDNDSARCICGDEFKGDICEMEKYSTVDQVTVYYFLGPIFIIYLLVCIGIFIQARNKDKEEKKSWIFFLLRFLVSCLGIFDLLTDIFFIIQSYDYGIENNNFGFFWSSLIFTIVPWSLAAICTGIFLVTWKKKLDSNGDHNQNNFMIFSFFTVVSLLSANGVETFHLVTQYLFLKEGRVIQVSDYAGYLTIYFIIKTFIEDFPQLIIQGIYQSKLGKANAIVTLSLANSALSCFITAVTFPFTHEFEYIKHKINKMMIGSGNFYQPSKENLFQMQ